MAPELIALQGYAYSADYWSMGVMLYEMLHAYTPFSAENTAVSDHDIIENIHTLVAEVEPAAGSTNRLAFGAHTSTEVRTVICDLLRKQPSERASSAEVRSSEFFDGLDWEALQHKRLSPPYVPNVTADPFDTSFFTAEIDDENTGPKILTEPAKEEDESDVDVFESF